MFITNRWSHVLTAALTLGVASSTMADDVFVKEGVVVKPLSKWKQRRLEKKVLRNPGSQVVVEGSPTAVTTVPEATTGVKVRRSFRPLFSDRATRRSEVVGAPSVMTSRPAIVSTPATIVSSPRSTTIAPGDPLVIPGSVEVTPTPRVVRPPIVSVPRGTVTPTEPGDESEYEVERPASVRVLPPPAEEIPPVVSTPRNPTTTPATPSIPVLPMPAPPSEAPLPREDSSPLPATPPAAPEPAIEPTLELPAPARPA